MKTFLWIIFPYICLTSFVLGHFWRYKYDKFGWTSRSSELYEKKILSWGSPLFHFGILGVFAGHVVGLLVPESWTNDAGISEHTYHLVAVVMGTAAGIATVTRPGEHHRRESVWHGRVFGWLQLPRFGGRVVPGRAHFSSKRRSDDGSAMEFRAARTLRNAATWSLALHPTSPRSRRASWLRVPSLYCLPESGGAGRLATAEAWLGESRPARRRSSRASLMSGSIKALAVRS